MNIQIGQRWLYKSIMRGDWSIGEIIDNVKGAWRRKILAIVIRGGASVGDIIPMEKSYTYYYLPNQESPFPKN